MTTGEMTLLGVPESVAGPLLAELTDRGVEARVWSGREMRSAFDRPAVMRLFLDAHDFQEPWDSQPAAAVEAAVGEVELREVVSSLYVAPDPPARLGPREVAVRSVDEFVDVVDEVLRELWRGGDPDVAQVRAGLEQALAALAAYEADADARDGWQDVDMAEDMRRVVVRNMAVLDDMVVRVSGWRRRDA